MKTCKKCLIKKENTEYYKHPDFIDKLNSRCKNCCAQALKNNYIKNKKTILEKQKQYRNLESSKKLQKEYQILYRIQNKEKLNKYHLEHYYKNKKELNDKATIYVRNKRRNDIQYKLKASLRRRLNNALKRNQKSGSAVKDLGCSIEFLKQYLKSKFQSGMTWDNHGKWHIDHIIPLSNFNLSNRKELLNACHYTNLQPLWAIDNYKKNDKI